MKTDIIIFGILLSFVPILFIAIALFDIITSVPIHKCVTQAIEAKISADDIQKICHYGRNNHNWR